MLFIFNPRKKNGQCILNGFFIGCGDPVWNAVIRGVVGKGCVFDYISGTKSQTKGIEFGDITIFHDYLDGVRGIRPVGFESAEWALDAETLHIYQDAEVACLDVSDRMDKGGSFSYQERLRLYLSVLSFWLFMVDKYKPKFIIFPQTPHQVTDLALYHVAKKNDIRTFMLLPIVALRMMLPISEIEHPTKDVVRTYEDYLRRPDEEYLLSPFLADYLERHKGTYEGAMPEYLKQRLDKELPASRDTASYYWNKITAVKLYPHYVGVVFKSIIAIIYRTKSFIFGKSPANYLKRPNEPLEASYISGFEYNIYKLKARWYKNKLKKKHNTFVSNLDYRKDYIYIPLQYQPERTSSPEGGRYCNQLLMIRLISSQLPKNWEIVVKENPSQLLPNTLHGERGRYSYYYSDLAQIPHVRIVSLDTPQFDLIDNCRAVATMTGTTGWEACVRGKPVMAFGYAWYSGCEGVFRVNNRSECRAAMEEIASGVELDQQKVRIFLNALERHSFEGYPNLKISAGAVDGIKNNTVNILKMLEVFLTDLGGNK